MVPVSVAKIEYKKARNKIAKKSELMGIEKPEEPPTTVIVSHLTVKNPKMSSEE